MGERKRRKRRNEFEGKQIGKPRPGIVRRAKQVEEVKW